MKKLLLILLIICPIVSYGQVKSSSETYREVSICKYSNTMELIYNEPTERYGIWFLSSNRYDSRCYLSLGEYEDALFSIDFFLDKMNILKTGETIEVEIGSEVILFTAEKYFGKCLIFRPKRQAGISYMHKVGLEKFKPEIINYQHKLDSLSAYK